MKKEISKTYNCWDLKQPEILSRSHLHSLKPIGVGTQLVESLSSYISRLASSHTCSTGTLVMNQIVPLIFQLSERYYKKDSKNSFARFVDRNSGALNGNGLTANSFVLAFLLINFLLLTKIFNFIKLEQYFFVYRVDASSQCLVSYLF